MKKVFSLLLAVLMLVSALPVAYAADVDYTVGTAVVYTASNNADYSITVPASLDPSASGTVTLSGSWASNQTVKVTADKTVTLTNSINAKDQKTLDVTFAGMEKAGDNSEAKTYTETVSVAAMPSDALFGTWDGKFNYYVELVETSGSNRLLTFSFSSMPPTSADFELHNVSYTFEEGMTWREFVNSEYNIDGKFGITNDLAYYKAELDTTPQGQLGVIVDGERIRVQADDEIIPNGQYCEFNAPEEEELPIT